MGAEGADGRELDRLRREMESVRDAVARLTEVVSAGFRSFGERQAVQEEQLKGIGHDLHDIKQRLNGGGHGPSLEVVLAELNSRVRTLEEDRAKRARFGWAMLVAIVGMVVHDVWRFLKGGGP